MKKTLLALAIAGAFSGAAFAQSAVTLSGIVDLSLQSRKNMACNGDANSDSSLCMVSGAKDASRFTLSGSEDLGSGLTANFTLQQRWTADDGVAASSGKQFVFSTLGLSSASFGTVSFGRQFSVTDDTGWDTGYGYNVGNWAALDTLVDNSIKWKSVNFSGLTLEAIYGFGEKAGDNSLGSWSGIGATYSNGPIWVALGYDQNKAAANQTKKSTSLSGTYDFGSAKVGLGYTKDDDGLSNSDDTNTINLGVSVPLSKVAGVAVEIGRVKQGDAKLNKMSLNAHYDLSARTLVYGGFTRAKADNVDAQTKLGVGIQHSF